MSRRLHTLSVEGEGVVTAADIQADQDIEIMNPDQVIATLNGGTDSKTCTWNLPSQKAVAMSVLIRARTMIMPIGVIAVDAIYTPVEQSQHGR